MNSKHATATGLITTTVLLSLLLQWYSSPVLLPRTAFAPLTAERILAGIQAEQRQHEFIAAVLAATRVYETNGCNPWLAEQTAHQAIRTGLPARLLAADVVVESSCRPDIISPKGAVGLTQVMPKVWGVSREELLNPDRNLEIGSNVLAKYVKTYGVHSGLRHYLGTGTTDGAINGNAYADRVLAVAYKR